MKRKGIEIPVKHEVSNAFAAVSLVHQGLGYMITDKFTVDPIYLNDLKLIPISPAPSIEYAICVSTEVRDHPMRDRFIEIVTNRLDS